MVVWVVQTEDELLSVRFCDWPVGGMVGGAVRVEHVSPHGAADRASVRRGMLLEACNDEIHYERPVASLLAGLRSVQLPWSFKLVTAEQVCMYENQTCQIPYLQRAFATPQVQDYGHHSWSDDRGNLRPEGGKDLLSPPTGLGVVRWMECWELGGAASHGHS
eukprot:SAG11_NODE_29_length_23137_cov_16.739995_15_plen_162_part_00